jgi:hypothetical protein
MVERNVAACLARIRELECALLASTSEVHRDGGCGKDGTHKAECTALFEKLGWGSYEQFKAAMEALGPSRIAGRP